MKLNPIIKKDLDILRDSLSRHMVDGKTFLVAGGAGFLGSWFCDTLNTLNARIICVDNLLSGSDDNISHLKKDAFQLVKSDIISYKPTEKIDYIVNMACIASPPLYQKHPIQTLDASVLGTRNLLEIARKNDIEGFLLSSTSEIYGDATIIPTPEDYWGNVNPIGPRSIYDEGKRVAETYSLSYCQKYGLPVRIARIFNTYGPRLDTKSTNQYGRVIVKFIDQALKSESITVYGDGRQTRSFCYITDQIVGLFKLLLRQGIDGQVVNLGNDDERTILELAKFIIKLTNSKSEITFQSLPKDDPKRRRPDIRKAEELLEWQPKVSLEEGLTKTVAYTKH